MMTTKNVKQSNSAKKWSTCVYCVHGHHSSKKNSLRSYNYKYTFLSHSSNEIPKKSRKWIKTTGNLIYIFLCSSCHCRNGKISVLFQAFATFQQQYAKNEVRFLCMKCENETIRSDRASDSCAVHHKANIWRKPSKNVIFGKRFFIKKKLRVAKHSLKVKHGILNRSLLSEIYLL